MADQLALTSLCALGSQPPAAVFARWTSVALAAAEGSFFPLFLDGTGNPRLALAVSTSGPAAAVALARLKILKPENPALPRSLLVLPESDQLLINGVRPALLKVLSPGDILTIAGWHWLLVRHFRPEPEDVPAFLAEENCPVCGMPLKLSKTMLRCEKGCAYHCEDPSQPENRSSLLNCYFESRDCVICGSEKRLDDQLIPDPSSLRWLDRFEYSSNGKEDS